MKKKKSSNRPLYILLGVAGLLLVVLGVGRAQGWFGGKKSTEVETAAAERATIVEKVSASGSVQPVVEVKISPEVSGEIIDLFVEEGDSVIMGTLLLRINPDNFEAALERALANLNQQKANLEDARARFARAKASLKRAEQEYQRQKKLFDEEVVAQADFELSTANFEIAQQDLKSAEQNVEAAAFIVRSSQATVDEARENLRRTSITSPMTGIVSKLSVEKGETVLGTSQMQGTEMLRIADLSNMEVRVDVNENDIIKVTEGDETIIDVDSYSYQEKQFKGLVTHIANTANDKATPDAVTEFEVRIKILNSSYADLIREGSQYPFRPGMTATVDIVTETKEDILTVPLSSVTTRPKDDIEIEEGEENQEEVLFLFEDGVARKVAVTVGISDFERIQIMTGVEDGDQVISGPFLAVSKNLKDGDLVKKKSDGDDDEESSD